jgi:hypothetical protein
MPRVSQVGCSMHIQESVRALSAGVQSTFKRMFRAPYLIKEEGEDWRRRRKTKLEMRGEFGLESWEKFKLIRHDRKW